MASCSCVPRAGATRWVALVLFAGAAVQARSFTRELDSVGRDQAELWVDPYYSAVNLTHSLVSQPIARLDADAEGGAHLWLLKRFFQPRDILLEGSVNPLPTGGWALRKWAPGAWDGAGWGSTNLLQALVEGFPEPWAASMFLGNVVDLVSGADTSKVTGVAYSGLLLSGGTQHLVQSRLLDDRWIEAEIKLKGDDIRASRKLGWSFRGGWRWNSDTRVRDVFYGSLVRRRTDFQDRGLDILRNSSLELRLDLDRRLLPRIAPLRMTAVVGKKYPVAGGAAALCISAGVVDHLRPAYVGTLRPLAPRGLQLVLQPNVEW